FLDEMRNRLQEFALSLHPDKTRLIEFGRLAAANREQRGLGKPETFNFLGFTFMCGKSRQGFFLLKRKTRRDRMRAKLRMVKQKMRRRMHQPIPEQGRFGEPVVNQLVHPSPGVLGGVAARGARAAADDAGGRVPPERFARCDSPHAGSFSQWTNRSGLSFVLGAQRKPRACRGLR